MPQILPVAQGAPDLIEELLMYGYSVTPYIEESDAVSDLKNLLCYELPVFLFQQSTSGSENSLNVSQSDIRILNELSDSMEKNSMSVLVKTAKNRIYKVQIHPNVRRSLIKGKSNLSFNICNLQIVVSIKLIFLVIQTLIQWPF